MTNEPKFKVGDQVLYDGKICEVIKTHYQNDPYSDIYMLNCEGEKRYKRRRLLKGWEDKCDFLKIKNVVFRPDKRRVTIVFDGFLTRATCKEGEEYRPLLGFLIAYFKAVKKLQGWNSKMVQRYFEGVLYYLPPEEQEAYLKAVYFENAKPTFKQALSLFDDVEAYWEKRL